ncbi:MAG: patatin-like phospholipase family protein [Gemmatimonadales bacterium]
MTARRRSRGRRIGLALAGGGLEGAVYEIGALRALEESLAGLDLNDLHVYVGVSAGAFVAAGLVNRITPSQMTRALVTHEPRQHPFVPSTFFTPAYREFTRRSLTLPLLVADIVKKIVKKPGDQTVLSALMRLARALPVGIFDNEPIRRYLERSFALKGRSDDFRALPHKLVVVSTDLGTGRTIRFGEQGWDHVPISRAVQASTALPGLYPPVHIEGHDCVDGVLLRTVHASVALEAGADLLLCINPLVPADLGQLATGAANGPIVKKGLPTVLSQTFRTLIHSRLKVGMATYARRFPNADVLLFEPGGDEYTMFFTNMFSFSARQKVCELAYQSTRRHLRARRAELEPVFARHGITFRDRLLEDEDRTVWDGVGMPEASSAPAVQKLGRALAHLEAALG